MKTLTKTFAKRALSILLVAIMVLSLGVVGLTTASATETELTSTGKTLKVGDYIYFVNCYDSDLKCNWIISDGVAWAHLWNGSTEHDIKFELYEGNANEAGAVYRAKVTKEYDYTNIIITRNSSSSTGPWNSEWNRTGTMTLNDDNCFTKIYLNGTSYESKVFYPAENVYLVGTFNNWVYDNGQMTDTGADYRYEKTITLEANTTYEFKVLNWGIWYSVDGTMTEDSCTKWDLYTDNGNVNITTTRAGDYKFEFWGDVHQITVTYPEAPFSANVYADAVSKDVAKGDNIVITYSYDYTPVDRDNTVNSWSLYLRSGSDVIGPISPIGGRFEYSTSDLELGAYTFYVEASITADGETKTYTSADVTVNVTEAEEENLTISAADLNVYAGQSTNIKVTSNITDGRTVTYHYYLNGENVGNNTTGNWTVNTTEDMADTTLVYTITAEVASSDGTKTLTDEITVNVKVYATSGGDGLVTIYFKSAESYGYVPSIKFGEDGTYTEMTKSAVVIGHNTTNTGHYYWYSATATPVDGKVTFSLTSPRFFKDCTYTLDINTEAPEVTGSYEYYFGIDNLNLVTSEVVNLTGKEYKNYFNTIIDMITEVSADTLVETGAYFECVAMGDANGDGKVNVRDATIIQKDLAKIAELSEVGNLVADVNDDGNVTIKDATAIQKQLANL